MPLIWTHSSSANISLHQASHLWQVNQFSGKQIKNITKVAVSSVHHKNKFYIFTGRSLTWHSALTNITNEFSNYSWIHSQFFHGICQTFIMSFQLNTSLRLPLCINIINVTFIPHSNQKSKFISSILIIMYKLPYLSASVSIISWSQFIVIKSISQTSRYITPRLRRRYFHGPRLLQWPTTSRR